MHKPNLDMGLPAVYPQLQLTMVRHALMHVWGQSLLRHLAMYYVTVTVKVYSTHDMCDGILSILQVLLQFQLPWTLLADIIW